LSPSGLGGVTEPRPGAGGAVLGHGWGPAQFLRVGPGRASEQRLIATHTLLLALAISRRAYLVTGDQDLLVLSSDLPILTPAHFATELRESD
jgi:hypothetical protein